MELIEPSAAYKDSFIEAVKEFQAESEPSQRGERYRALSIEELERDFEGFAVREREKKTGKHLPEGYVPQSIFWLIDGGEFIGQVDIRHRDTEHLLRFGGHIGYDIRPSKRRQGYGTKILALALPKARELGLARVLITCDESNTSSRRVIEKNGGVFESKERMPETGEHKLRYWIKR